MILRNLRHLISKVRFKSAFGGYDRLALNAALRTDTKALGRIRRAKYDAVHAALKEAQR